MDETNLPISLNIDDISYVSKLPDSIIELLMGMIEPELKKYNEVAQLFIIQYTYFEFIMDKWSMKTFLDIGEETLQNINLFISKNGSTFVTVYSQNPKFGVLKIKNLLDMRDRSRPGLIYACDLYYHFEPQHFYGKCYTSLKN